MLKENVNKANVFVQWSDDGNRVATSMINFATALLCRSTVYFGNGERKEYEPAKLVGYETITDKQVEREIDLSHVQEGEKMVLCTEFRGLIFYIEGQDLRLRTRACAHHRGESFDDMKLPRGEMRLEVDALQKGETHKLLMEIIKGKR